MAFREASDMIISSKNDFKNSFKQQVLSRLMTDTLPLFDALLKAACKTNRNFMLYMQTVRAAYNIFEIIGLFLVRSDNNITYLLSKAMCG